MKIKQSNNLSPFNVDGPISILMMIDGRSDKLILQRDMVVPFDYRADQIAQ